MLALILAVLAIVPVGIFADTNPSFTATAVSLYVACVLIIFICLVKAIRDAGE